MDKAELIDLLKRLAEVLTDLGADGEPGDMPAPILEETKLAIEKIEGGAK
jgi:hypothetical protein